jgi:hypothetical protein
MDWQLDHVFLAVRDLAASEQLLSEFGMTFTQRGAHSGQGTINACAMFENAFFELLGPGDSAELQSDVVKPLGLKERIEWRGSGACPFGLCFRPSHAVLDVATLPFPTWAYAPPYLPAGDSLPIGTTVVSSSPPGSKAYHCSSAGRGRHERVEAVVAGAAWLRSVSCPHLVDPATPQRASRAVVHWAP